MTCLVRYENQRLEGLTFDLDDDEIVGCHLVDCRILLGGKRLPIFSDNHSQGCDFEFSKSALVTIQMLRRMLKFCYCKTSYSWSWDFCRLRCRRFTENAAETSYRSSRTRIAAHTRSAELVPSTCRGRAAARCRGG